jgi:surface antigen
VCFVPRAFAYDDYPYKSASSYGVDPWGFYNCQCVSFVAWRMNRDAGTTSAPYVFSNWMSGGHWGNANHWDDNARTLGYTVNTTPAVGAIAHWDAWEGGAWSYGHVVYVERVNSDGTVNISEYNWATAIGYGERYGRRAARYIHFNSSGSPTPPDPPDPPVPPDPPQPQTFSGRINDEFIGEGWQGTKESLRQKENDVLSSPENVEYFDIHYMGVEISDDWMSIDIRTDYTEGVVPGLSPFYTTYYGDLFISVDGWEPESDLWEYVFDVSEMKLYDICNAQDQILCSDDLLAWPADEYRNGQEVQIDPTGLTAIGQGSAGKSGDYYSLNFDIASLRMDLLNLNLGFHWAMSCANDVIEGGITTPEPSTLLLITAGLIGIAALRRRRSQESGMRMK